MSMYDKPLNMDDDRIKTPAEYDEATNKWVIHMRDAGTIFGESTDVKPTNVPEGTVFAELDGDKDVYIFHKGQWRLY